MTDAGHGIDYAFRQGLTEQALAHVVGITSTMGGLATQGSVAVAQAIKWHGSPRTMSRLFAKHQSKNGRALLLGLPDRAFHIVSWPEGINERLSGRFAALRVRCVGGTAGKAHQPPEQCPFIECSSPQSGRAPEILPLRSARYDSLERSGVVRLRVERDYQNLKQDFGSGHYVG